MRPADFRPNVLRKCHHWGSGTGVVPPSRARGAGIGAVETRGVPLMKKLLLTSVALTALFGGSAFAADLRPAYKARRCPRPCTAGPVSIGA